MAEGPYHRGLGMMDNYIPSQLGTGKASPHASQASTVLWPLKPDIRLVSARNRIDGPARVVLVNFEAMVLV